MNNNSKVLALKYRPQSFDDLIGQEVVAETITNSIKADIKYQMHIYLLVSEELEKQRIARIVAKVS